MSRAGRGAPRAAPAGSIPRRNEGARLVAFVGAALVLGACNPAAAPPSSSASSPTPSVTTSTAPSAPNAPSASPIASLTPHPGDGVPDLDGRIAFGRITQEDPSFGQVVALFAIDPDGSDLLQLNDGDSGYPAWSPDGSRLAFTQRQDDGTWQIATMALDGTNVQVLTTGLGADGATWSPDGTWIGFNRFMTGPDDPNFRTTLWRMDADGSNPTPLGDQEAFDVEPRISPNGTEILFERLSFAGGQRQELVVRNIETGKERVISAVGTAVEHANWSPDGVWIIYDISPTLGADVPSDQVERIAADGTGEVVVLFPAASGSGGFKPWYSPDGSRILFGCFRNEASDAACLMDADGSNVTILVDTPKHENHFSWGPAAP